MEKPFHVRIPPFQALMRERSPESFTTLNQLLASSVEITLGVTQLESNFGVPLIPIYSPTA